MGHPNLVDSLHPTPGKLYPSAAFGITTTLFKVVVHIFVKTW